MTNDIRDNDDNSLGVCSKIFAIIQLVLIGSVKAVKMYDFPSLTATFIIAAKNITFCRIYYIVKN